MIDITTLESVWSKCPWCKSEYTIVDDDFGQPVHPHMIRYCWHCGSPLTPEAVEEMAGRLPTLTPPNEPLTCEGCMYIDEYFGPCAHCMRARGYVDRYRRLPEGEAK